IPAAGKLTAPFPVGHDLLSDGWRAGLRDLPSGVDKFRVAASLLDHARFDRKGLLGRRLYRPLAGFTDGHPDLVAARPWTGPAKDHPCHEHDPVLFAQLATALFAELVLCFPI